MKRILSLALALFLLISLPVTLASCGKEWKYVTEAPTYVSSGPKYLVIYHNIKDIQKVGEYKVYVKGYSSETADPENCLFEQIGTLSVFKLEKNLFRVLNYSDNYGYARSHSFTPDEWKKITRKNN